MGDKVVLGLSGGVDSAVAARLLEEAGYQVHGLYLDNGLPGAQAARAAAESLGIPLTVRDVRRDMEEAVCRPFAEGYLRGETPNPCIVCNPAVKFRALLEEAGRVDARYIATGHYARVREGGLYRGERDNDQSYMLCRLEPEQLGRLLLPLGPYRKQQVRAMAQAWGLPCAGKPDSMEICFIPSGDYAAWIEARGAAPPPGDFLLDGAVAGRHRGIHHYTVGQRRHLGVAAGSRVYVSQLRPEENQVVLARGDALWSSAFSLRELSWLIPAPDGPVDCLVRVRHSRRDMPPCTVVPEGGGAARVLLPVPLRAPAPGQAAVFYRDDRLIGSGFIAK